MNSTLILNAKVVNEGTVTENDVLIKGQHIEKIGSDLQSTHTGRIIDAEGKFLIPGAIDDQVHFREPGLTHKASIYTESRAAVAGGVTSFMEMPNTIPPAFTQALLEDKYQIAAENSLGNYSFYMGASNDNLEEVLKTDINRVCGLKIFMGSSTGNLLVDDTKTLEGFYSKFPSLIATHCEDEPTILRNIELYKEKYGDSVTAKMHADIRSHEACYLSSSSAVALAKRYGTQLHILHISTEKETHLFDNSVPLKDKKITAEACVHHLWFNDSDYDRLGMLIKWNPAVKTREDQEGVLKALLDDRIDVIATDHAPHTWEEKQNTYFSAPSGGPLVQHSIVAMMEFYKQGKITIERIVEKMCHNPSILFRIEKRGYIREGYFADLVLVDPETAWQVEKKNIVAKCGWSPFEGYTFSSSIYATWVSGHLAFHEGKFDETRMGARMTFRR